MLTQRVVVNNEHGLHLRVASKIVETCQLYQASVLVCHDCKPANGRSMLDLLRLEATQGCELEVIVDGTDAAHEAKTLAAVANVFCDGAGI